MPSEAQQKAAFISAASSSNAYFLEPKEPERSRFSRCRGAAGMTEFVQRRAAPIDRLEIGLRRWDPHIVVRGHVEGATAADAEVDARCFDQRLDCGLDQAGSGGGAAIARFAGRPSHWARLKTVKRFRNGIACASSPVSRARFFSSSGTKRSA